MGIDTVRNISIIAHIDAGKTTTTERILYYSGKTHRLGEVHEGSATMDWMDQEQERGITITSAATNCTWKYQNKDYQINLIDTPGHVDFTIEVERSLRVIDGAVVIFCGVAGVQPQSEMVWRQADKFHLPRLAVVNKLDREGASFKEACQQINQQFEQLALPITIPWGEQKEFKGVLDLVRLKAYVFTEDSQGLETIETEIPEEEEQRVKEWRDRLLDELSLHDDTLLELCLENKTIPIEILARTIKKLCLANKIVPVFAASAFKNKGIQPLLNGIIAYLPSPIETPPIQIDEKHQLTADPQAALAALVFKIQSHSFGLLCYARIYSGTLKTGMQVYNVRTEKSERINKIFLMHAQKKIELKSATAGEIVALLGLNTAMTGDSLCQKHKPIRLQTIQTPETVMTAAIEPKTSAEDSQLQHALAILTREDPSFKQSKDPETGQTVVSGMGELHLDIILERLKREFKVQARLGKPQIAYRETISKTATETFMLDKTIMGKESYAKVGIHCEPQAQGAGSQILLKDGLAAGLAENIEAGLKESMSAGLIAGYPLVDLLVQVTSVETNEQGHADLACRIAAVNAFRQCLKKAEPKLLEPIMHIEVEAPDTAVGEILADINGRKGRVLAIHKKKDWQKVQAEVALSTMFGYSTALRSLSKGRAAYSMVFDHHAQLKN